MKVYLNSITCPLAATLLMAFGASSASATTPPPATFFGATNHQPYMDWVNAKGTLSYDHATFIRSVVNPNHGVAVHWTIEGDLLRLAMAARAEGWVGFGLAEAGGMEGSDMILFEADKPDQVKDAFVGSQLNPVLDECNDWTFVDSFTDDGFLIVEASRLLDTGDNQDRAIIDDSNQIVVATRVIAAWGDTPTVGYHGNNRARGTIRWFQAQDEANAEDEQVAAQAFTEHPEIEIPANGGFFDLRANDYPIKPIDTEYAHFCLTRSQLTAAGVPLDARNLVAFEPIVDADAIRHVHHFTVYGSMDANEGLDCSSEEAFATFLDMVYVWTPGEEPLVLPENLGMPMLPEDKGYQSFRLEVHYDNPSGVEGVLDSSGVRFYYTTEEREFTAAFLQLGDPFVNLGGDLDDEGGEAPTLVGDGFVEHSFDCPSTCSSVALTEPVTVIREYFHMHKTGARMYNEQIRDGKVIRTSVAEHFRFNQQGNQAILQQPFQVQPGDGFRTVCQYNSKDGEVFGLSSSEEMCINFVLYYPRQEIGDSGFPWFCGYDLGTQICDSTWTQRDLGAETDLGRVFGTSDGQCSVDNGNSGGTPGADGPSDTTVGSSATTTMFLQGSLASLAITLIATLAL